MTKLERVKKEIEKVEKNIEKVEDTLNKEKDKLSDLNQQKIELENENVVALFRKEKLNEDQFAQLLHSIKRTAPEKVDAETEKKEGNYVD